MQLSDSDRNEVLGAINQENKKFAKVIFRIAETYSVFGIEDIKLLENKNKLDSELNGSFPFPVLMKKYSENGDRNNIFFSGQNRYYPDLGFRFEDQEYMISSQWYGPKSGSRDNRTPFYNWFIKKLDISKEVEIENVIPSLSGKTGETMNAMNNIIYYGVPGTGKTFRIQLDYINNPEKRQNTITTTFHQSFGYEEFVEGIKAKVNKQTNQIEYKVEKGIFYKACEKAAELAGFSSLEELLDSQEREDKIQKAIENGAVLYFCIDEINRGNIASIFGELISLIEPSKRIGLGTATEMTVTLPYSGDLFGVPANLKIIGTMNTADRSIQLLDSALRRRFSFIECMPDYNVLTYSTSKSILKKINNRIRALLGKDYQIGHAYLINSGTDLDVFFCLRDRIIPLLEEYFYGETEKIRIVLNENDYSQNDYSFYVLDEEASSSISDIDDSIRVFKLNPDIFNVSTESDASKFISHI